MTRQFRAYEYVDGDVRVYARLKGQDDSQWKELGLVPFEMRQKTSTANIAKGMGITLNGEELTSLSFEISNPRRW